MPFPSAACYTCKVRRIKCDENKPTCQRCTKSRRICVATGAAKDASFSIHIENCYASGKNKRPRGPRSSLTVLRPHLDLQTRAVAYFLQCHLQTLTDVPYMSGCFSDCVSAFKISGKTYRIVDLALSSLGLAVFSQTQRYPPAATEASSQYHHLLRFMQVRIAQVGTPTLSERDIDAYLLAILFMGRYEVVTYHPGDLDSRDSSASTLSWSHQDGALAILKLWNDHLSHRAATLIVKQSRRKLVKSSLLRKLSLPDWILNGARFGECDLALVYDRIFIRIVDLHHASASFQQKEDSQITYAEELNIEAQELDNALQDWAAQLPATWSYQRHILTESGPWPKRHFYSPVVYSYSRLGHVTVWSQYFASRMLINSARLRFLQSSLRDPSVDCNYEQQRSDCISQMNAMTDSLASTIPFCLERFKVADSPKSPTRQTSITINTNEEIKPYLASLVTWPRTIASSLEWVDIRQQLWFRSELAQLGTAIGDGVLECADTDHWALLRGRTR